MKKLLISLCVLLSINMMATNYLVQLGGVGNPTWRAVGQDEVLVDLSVLGKTLPEWYNITFTATPTVAAQIWLIKGTYSFNATIAEQSKVSIYGGFDGTEIAISARLKSVNAKYWEFTNETVWDGNNSTQFLTAGGARTSITYDGISFTRGGVSAVRPRGSEIFQNCIFKDNQSSTKGAALLLYAGSGSTGNSVKRCYFYNNSATGTGSGLGLGGAIAVLGTTSAPHLIQECLFKNNNADVNGSDIYLESSGAITVQNSLITGATGINSVYLMGTTNFYNNTFVNNGSCGMYISGTPAVKVYNSVFWGGTNGLAGGGAATSEVKNCALNMTPRPEWTVANNIQLESVNTGVDASKYYPAFTDPTIGDFTLSSESSLVDRGDGALNATITTDFLGAVRPMGSTFDLGCYEFQSLATSDPEIIDKLQIFNSKNRLHINGLTEKALVSIYDIYGRLISTFTANQDLICEVAANVYIVKVIQNGTIVSCKLLAQ